MFRRNKKPTLAQQPESSVTYCAYSCESCGTQLAIQLEEGKINEIRGSVTCGAAKLHLMMYSQGIISDTQIKAILDDVVGSGVAGQDASKLFDHLPAFDIESAMNSTVENTTEEMQEWMEERGVPQDLWSMMLDIINKPESMGMSFDDASSSPDLELIAKSTRLRVLATYEGEYEPSTATATLVAEHTNGNLYEVQLGDKTIGVYRPHIPDEPNLRQQHERWVSQSSDDLVRFGFDKAEQAIITQELLSCAEYDNTSTLRRAMEEAKDGLEELVASIAQEKTGLPHVESKILLENNRSKAVVIKMGLNASDILATLLLLLDSQFTPTPGNTVQVIEA
jgi:hypothetical protein